MRVFAVVVTGLAATAACGRFGFDQTIDAECEAGICTTIDTATMIDGAVPRVGNVVFVTSTRHLPAAIGSVANGHPICQARANEAQLQGTFHALLSSSANMAVDQLGTARGFVRIDGLPIADLPIDVFTRMRRPILFNERGEIADPAVLVMTGATAAGAVGADCNGYSNSSTLGQIHVGYPTATMESFGAGAIGMCSDTFALYCFQIDLNVDLPEPAIPATARRAFVTSPMNMGSGIGTFDTACANAATTAGLVGSFKALVSSSATSPSARFSAAGTNWVRTDGVAVAATPQQLLAGDWIAPINTTANGTSYVRGNAWSGTTGISQAAVASAACDDWVTFSATASRSGDLAATGSAAFDFARTAGALNCNDAGRAYCLEE